MRRRPLSAPATVTTTVIAGDVDGSNWSEGSAATPAPDAVSVVRVDDGLGRPCHSVAPVAALLAHQGGWDEMLLVLAPIAVVAALLWIAKRRVDRAAARQDGSTERAPR